MKFFCGVFAAIITSTVVQAQNGYPDPVCYFGTSGVQECSQFIDTFCTDAGVAAAPVIRVGDGFSRCFALPNGRRCDLVAFNTFTGSNRPSSTNCGQVLRNVINRCPSGMGGYARNGPQSYTFSIDINAGSCSQNIQGPN